MHYQTCIYCVLSGIYSENKHQINYDEEWDSINEFLFRFNEIIKRGYDDACKNFKFIPDRSKSTKLPEYYRNMGDEMARNGCSDPNFFDKY